MGLFRSKARQPLLVSKKHAAFKGFANLPQPFKKADKKNWEVDEIHDRLHKLARYPVRQLEDASNILSSLNRLKLRPDKRQALLDSLIRITYPIISAYYEKYQVQQSSLPEGEERRNALVASITLSMHIIACYKLLFSEIYDREVRKHDKHGNLAYRYGFRILEFVLIEQRLRALRYQKLSRQSWIDCNQVFFSLAVHGLIDIPLELHGVMGIKSKPQGQKVAGYVLLVSLRRLYLSIQIFGVLDVSTLPTHLYHIPDIYLESLNYGVDLVVDDGESVQPGHLLSWQMHDRIPLFERPEMKKEAGIKLDFTDFYNALVKDYETIASMKFINNYDDAKLSRPMQNVREEDRVPLLQMMLTGLHKRERASKRYAVFKNNRVSIYFSMTEVMRLLTRLASDDIQQVYKQHHLADYLAKKSSTLITSEDAPTSSEWEMVNFSAGGILISTLETDFSNYVQLGQLVVFKPDDQESTHSVGFVCRINRPQDSLVEVGITRLANSAEAVAIQGIEGQESSLYFPAILIRDSRNNWQLIIAPQDELQSGLPLRLIRDNKSFPARLGNVILNKKEFTVIELRSPGLKQAAVSR